MLRCLKFLILTSILSVVNCLAAPQILIVEDAPWSPNDASREGAAELEVMLRVAKLQQMHEPIGLIGIGDRRGLFQEGTKRGLEFAVAQGVPVVRLARGMHDCLKGTNDLFINGGNLSPEDASILLAECLARHGGLPPARSASRPSASELRALKRTLKLYQAEFSAHQTTMIVAAR